LKFDGGDLEESAVLMSSADRRHVREGSSKSDAGMIATDVTELMLHRCEASLCWPVNIRDTDVCNCLGMSIAIVRWISWTR
jgi:hypothetical protein